MQVKAVVLAGFAFCSCRHSFTLGYDGYHWLQSWLHLCTVGLISSILWLQTQCSSCKVSGSMGYCSVSFLENIFLSQLLGSVGNMAQYACASVVMAYREGDANPHVCVCCSGKMVMHCLFVMSLCLWIESTYISMYPACDEPRGVAGKTKT